MEALVMRKDVIAQDIAGMIRLGGSADWDFNKTKTLFWGARISSRIPQALNGKPRKNHCQMTSSSQATAVAFVLSAPSRLRVTTNFMGCE